MSTAVQLAGTTPASLATNFIGTSFADFKESVEKQTLYPDNPKLPDDFTVGDLKVTPKTEGKGGFDLAAPVDINGTLIELTGTVEPGKPLGFGVSTDLDLGSDVALTLGGSVSDNTLTPSVTLSGSGGGVTASVTGDLDLASRTITPSVEFVAGDPENGLSATFEASPDEQKLSFDFKATF
jgi:hypothetical protein